MAEKTSPFAALPPVAEMEEKARWHEVQAAALRQIIRGVKAFESDEPILKHGSVTEFVAGRIAADRAKASDLRREALALGIATAEGKSVDKALATLVERGSIRRLGDGWYEAVPSV